MARIRLGFGKRFSVNPISEDMIVPVALFATDDQVRLVENRTRHYVIDGFNQLYGGKLASLPSWYPWTIAVDSLNPKCWGAFRGEINLHDFEPAIDSLASIYGALRAEYAEAGPDNIPAQH